MSIDLLLSSASRTSTPRLKHRRDPACGKNCSVRGKACLKSVSKITTLLIRVEKKKKKKRQFQQNYKQDERLLYLSIEALHKKNRNWIIFTSPLQISKINSNLKYQTLPSHHPLSSPETRADGRRQSSISSVGAPTAGPRYLKEARALKARVCTAVEEWRGGEGKRSARAGRREPPGSRVRRSEVARSLRGPSERYTGWSVARVSRFHFFFSREFRTS